MTNPEIAPIDFSNKLDHNKELVGPKVPKEGQSPDGVEDYKGSDELEQSGLLDLEITEDSDIGEV